MSGQTIQETMTIPEIIAQYPATKAVFERFGLQTEGYKALEYENLFATARVQRLDLQELLTELNKVAS